MIPSRRYGFQYMGSKRDFCTNLLVAIDVSGSVENNQISQALSIINRFFKYGVENIDVIQFDTEIHGEKESFKKAQRKYNIHGRGGTDFQAAVDMFIKDRYDGLIMITDGYADKPSLPKSFHGHILWMIYENDCIGGSRGRKLDEDLKWIDELPKNRYLILPEIMSENLSYCFEIIRNAITSCDGIDGIPSFSVERILKGLSDLNLSANVRSYSEARIFLQPFNVLSTNYYLQIALSPDSEEAG